MSRRLCLVTGASAGLGAAFARLYAAKGHDLALTARRGDRLEALAADLRRDFGVETIVLPADLADPASPRTLLQGLAEHGRCVDVLINNAGYGLTGGYRGSAWADQAAALQVMVAAPCELAHGLAPQMAERGYGRILNVASLAGLLPGGPGHTLYAPIKAFMVRFSQSLHMELKSNGVHVTALCPGFTYTEFHDANGTREAMRRLPPWMWMDAETVVRAGYAAAEANRAVCTPGAVNRLIAGLGRLLPEGLTMAVLAERSRRLGRV